MPPDENEQDANLETAEPDTGDDGADDESPFVAPDTIEFRDDEDERPGNVDANGEIHEPDGNDHLTPEALEKRAKRIETSFKTYTKAVERNYEDEFQYLAECPLCPDNHKGYVDLRSAGYVPQEVQDAVRMYFGVMREQDYAHSPTMHTCPDCEGKGKVATGSTVPEFVTVQCQRCGARGFIGDQLPEFPVNGQVTGPTVYQPERPATQAYDETDEWDEPRILPDGRENPNFGKMPNRKIAVEPWGTTAGLNAMSA